MHLQKLFLIIVSLVFFISTPSFSQDCVDIEETNCKTVMTETLNQSAISSPNAYQFSFKSIEGQDIFLSDYKDKVLLVVNTASQCGLTGQYKKLQDLYTNYKEKGLMILGVPCNDFGGQEPGTEAEIKEFTMREYSVDFPMTSKYSVKGKDAHPFFVWASEQNKGGFLFSKPRWNFHKYLIDKKGNLFKSYSSQTEPDSKALLEDIEKLLSQ